MRNIVEFLELLGAKPTGKQSEWLMTGECCGDRKLYFNIDKSVGFCVKCNRPWTLFDLAKTVNVPFRDIQEFVETQRLDEARAVGFRDSMVQGLLGHTVQQADKELVEMPWPKGYRSLQDGRNSVIGKQAINYLTGRGFSLSTLDGLQFGYCASGHYAGRVIIPTIMRQTLVYWQARDFTGRVSDSYKVLNPDVGPGANGKSEVLFNYDNVHRLAEVLVSESWGSALACGVSATAVNGKHISDVQLRLLGGMAATRFTIVFDAGQGTDAAWSNAERLSTIRETWIAELPYGDPNEVPNHVLNESIRAAQRYTKQAHIKFRLRSTH